MAPKHSFSSDVLKYIDMEASVDDSEDESEGSDNDQNDFVVTDDSLDLVDSTNGNWLLWDELEEWDDPQQSPEFLENLAEDIKRRHRTLHDSATLTEQDGIHAIEDHPMARFPTDEDVIFSVKVKAGLERDIVVSLLQKSLNSPSTHAILSAFCRDAIKGNIFVEAKTIAAVQNVLHGLPGVVRRKGNRGPFAVTSVDIQDRHLLLDMHAAGTLPIKAYSWARVKTGLYRGDLALVLDVNPKNLICSTLLVPRLNMSGKRKRGFRPPPVLFNPEHIRVAFGHDSTEVLNRGLWAFRGQAYAFGCLCKVIHVTGLSIEGINATPQELEPFRGCEIWDKAAKHISPIKIGDRVRIVSGTFVGMEGEISDVLDMTVKVKVTGKEGDIREVLTRDVRRAFKVGDFVQVVHGLDRGLEGFLVHLEGDTVAIFVLPPEDSNVLVNEGREIIAKTVDVEWKSNATNFLDIITPTTDFPSGRMVSDPQFPEGLPYAPPDPLLELTRRTIDPYKNMEVRIVKGDAKRHFGVVKGTRKSAKGEDLADVMTSTKAVNTFNTYLFEDLRERFTNMTLEKASNVPVRFRIAKVYEPAISIANRPSTPVPSTPAPPESADSGDTWNMKARTPDANTIPQTTVSSAGKWLLDPRLLFKKLDVRVQGTTLSHPPWQGGKFEGQLGWVILTKMIQSAEESTFVKTGFAQNRAPLLIRHLVPERSTEVPTYWPNTDASTSVFSKPGSRVVVIGPDFSECTDYVGAYALVTHCPTPLPPNCGLVQIASPGPNWGKYIYLDINSVCRSIVIPSPMNWFGTMVV